MIQMAHSLPVSRRCELLEVARSTAYYRSRPASDADLGLMRQIDELLLELPFYGSRRLAEELAERGHRVNRKRVHRLMRRMGLTALRAVLTRYFDFYNCRRRHTALDRRTPDTVYFDAVAKAAA